MHKKNIFLVFIVFIVLIIIVIIIIYWTHRSVKQEISSQDLEVIENLKSQESNTTAKIKNKTPEIKILKTGTFNSEARGSDRLHKGWGDLKIIENEERNKLVFSENFKVTNGPDYKIYLSEEKDIETEKEFFKVKNDSFQISDIEQFSGSQIYNIDKKIDIDKINSVVVWCEAFSEFITSADLK